MSFSRFRLPALATGLVFVSLTASATEYPVGASQYQSGMSIDAVYLQPVVMEPAGMMLAAEQADIHIEMDIHAAADNPNGFEEGGWIPYLAGRYRLQKKGSERVIEGELMPMVASDGPHYGDNVKLEGPGVYTLSFVVQPPSANERAHFGRHTDRLTGVRPWFKPFEVSWTFVYAGIGKKGGY